MKTLPPVVFIHGDLQNRSVFYKLASFFRKKGHETLLIDLPGHGLCRMNDSNKDIDSYLKSCLKDTKFPIIVANSSGCAFSMKLALEHSCSSLIFINPVLTHPKTCFPSVDLSSLYNHYLDKSTRLFKGQELFDYSSFDGSEEDISNKGFETTSTEGLKNNLDYYFSLPKEVLIGDIEVPILYIAAIDDSFVPYTYYLDCFAQLKRAILCPSEGGHQSLIMNYKEIEGIVSKNYDKLSGK